MQFLTWFLYVCGSLEYLFHTHDDNDEDDNNYPDNNDDGGGFSNM